MVKIEIFELIKGHFLTDKWEDMCDKPTIHTRAFITDDSHNFI